MISLLLLLCLFIVAQFNMLNLLVPLKRNTRFPLATNELNSLLFCIFLLLLFGCSFYYITYYGWMQEILFY